MLLGQLLQRCQGCQGCWPVLAAVGRAVAWGPGGWVAVQVVAVVVGGVQGGQCHCSPLAALQTHPTSQRAAPGWAALGTWACHRRLAWLPPPPPPPPPSLHHGSSSSHSPAALTQCPSRQHWPRCCLLPLHRQTGQQRPSLAAEGAAAAGAGAGRQLWWHCCQEGLQWWPQGQRPSWLP